VKGPIKTENSSLSLLAPVNLSLDRISDTKARGERARDAVAPFNSLFGKTKRRGEEGGEEG